MRLHRLRPWLDGALVALVLSTALAAEQATGVLRIRVALLDAAGVATPIPRVVLLISDNPATTEPRRVHTTTDGTAEIKLRPGNYTVESDLPIAFGGKAYAWTQMIDVLPGRDTVLDLTTKNAEIGDVAAAAASGAAPVEADSATLLARWHDSVVEIWTPTMHASGVVVDSRGLIATSQRAIGAATDVEVEIASAKSRVKVPGVVLYADRLNGTAIVRVDPAAIAPLRAMNDGCSAPAGTAPVYRDEVTAIAAPMLGAREMADGEVQRVTPQAIFVDMRLVRDAAGGPVFSSDGALLGLSAIADDSDARRASETFVVPVASMCEALAAAAAKMTGAPPPAVHLPLEPPPTGPRGVVTTPASKRAAPPALSSSSFDITLLTPDHLRDYGTANPRSDVGNWNDYVRDVSPVLLIRVSPQFEESFWKMLARGAAATQGMNLPPLKSFSSNFLKMRAFCGDAEVTPIHPFIVERQVPERAAIREGLYVFALDALGPRCPSIRLALYSEKEPGRPDVKMIDPKLFEQMR
jgi:S1-C subfamily serine protease